MSKQLFLKTFLSLVVVLVVFGCSYNFAETDESEQTDTLEQEVANNEPPVTQSLDEELSDQLPGKEKIKSVYGNYGWGYPKQVKGFLYELTGNHRGYYLLKIENLDYVQYKKVDFYSYLEDYKTYSIYASRTELTNGELENIKSSMTTVSSSDISGKLYSSYGRAYIYIKANEYFFGSAMDIKFKQKNSANSSYYYQLNMYLQFDQKGKLPNYISGYESVYPEYIKRNTEPNYTGQVKLYKMNTKNFYLFYAPYNGSSGQIYVDFITDNTILVKTSEEEILESELENEKDSFNPINGFGRLNYAGSRSDYIYVYIPEGQETEITFKKRISGKDLILDITIDADGNPVL